MPKPSVRQRASSSLVELSTLVSHDSRADSVSGADQSVPTPTGDEDLAVTESPHGLIFNGRKAFSTGSKVSDLTVLEGVFKGTETHVFAIAESKQDGIVYGDDWKDVLGMRGTQSGKRSCVLIAKLVVAETVT